MRGRRYYQLLLRAPASNCVTSVIKFSGSTAAFIAAGIVMVFLIQRAQHKDLLVLHPKLNELIAATQVASSRLINAQDFLEEEINLLHNFYCALAQLAKNDNDLGRTHSVEEVEDNDIGLTYSARILAPAGRHIGSN